MRSLLLVALEQRELGALPLRFGQAEVGAEFGMDPATFERVEIIRGPASSIYGDSAFFAVVNVITKTPVPPTAGEGTANRLA